jgi:RNA polymerase sigma-70 factor (sigma-E family)
MRREVDAEFAEYVRARQHQLLRAAYLVCGDAHLAEDLLQQALMKLALRWQRIRSENPDAYVRRILYRDAVSAWRRTRREHLDGAAGRGAGDGFGGGPAEDVHAAGDTEQEVAQRVDLARALADLTAKQRAVVVLRFFEDRSEAETADLLGVSVGTVKSQTHVALARLRLLIPDLAPTLSTKER